MNWEDSPKRLQEQQYREEAQRRRQAAMPGRMDDPCVRCGMAGGAYRDHDCIGVLDAKVSRLRRQRDDLLDRLRKYEPYADVDG